MRTFSGIACLSKVKILRKGMIKNAVQAVTASSLVKNIFTGTILMKQGTIEDCHWHYTYEARSNKGLSRQKALFVIPC